ncbi:MAG: redoxin domain-containing protein [Chitinophagaceae bacterium]|nr:redoxin domain-containing protein [Chitinophagaceae bacterium]
MKHLLIFVTLLTISSISFAQKDSTAPTYTHFPLPQFSVLLPDSTTWYTKKDLLKNKKTLVMVFSPDCEHCQHETEMIKANIAKFKRTQILMVTPIGFDKTKKFYDKYDLKSYKNITVGYDSKFFFTSYFKLKMFPFIAIYNKKYELLKTFEGTAKMDDLLEYIK